MARDEDTNPWLFAYRMAWQQQYQMMKACDDAWRAWLGLQERAMKDWMDLLAEHHPHRRWHSDLARGADIMDRYGHRAHDVDVERI